MDEIQVANAPAADDQPLGFRRHRGCPVALYVTMTMLADWNTFGRTLSSIPGVLWVEEVALSLLS